MRKFVPTDRLRGTHRLRFALAVLFALMLPTQLVAQSAPGRVAFGFDFEANKYWGNFTDNRFWLSGDAFLRVNILEWLSFHAAYNGGQIQIKASPLNVNAHPDYFGPLSDDHYPAPHTDIHRDEFNVVRHGGWQGMLSLNFFPTQTFVPYLIGGIEYLNWEPKNQAQGHALPNNTDKLYDKNHLGSVLGVGYELYLGYSTVFNGKGLLHMTGTDWLDDYAGPTKTPGTQDVFATFGVGFSYYIYGNLDSDHDGLNDYEEKNVYKTDPFNPDTDGDGLNDFAEVRTHHTDPLKADTDGDGLTDSDEIQKHKTDPVIADSDGDGLNDGEEVKTQQTNPLVADTDGDGLNDGDELKTYKTNPKSKDTDEDGLADGDEVQKYNTAPNKKDSDGDGISDGDEVNNYKTDPIKTDTDGDGLSDGDEVNQHTTDPLKVDSDGDRLNDGDEVMKYHTDPRKTDTDGDDLADGEEVLSVHTDPLKPDTDGDGVRDSRDQCPLIKGVPPEGCPPKPPVNTVTNFPGILFIVNTDNFDMTVPGTLENLNRIKALVDQCADIRVEIEGHASSEGDAARNQELSDLRAARVKNWLIEQGVKPEKIVRTVGYGSSKPLIPEPEPGKAAVKGKKGKAAVKGVTPEQLEAARKQNRRIAVRVVETCK